MNKVTNEGQLSKEPPVVSEDAFYANGITFNLSDTELVISFDRQLPGVKSETKTIILPPIALERLNQGINTLFNHYQSSTRDHTDEPSRE